MTRHPGDRLLAWLIDWVLILLWAAVVAAVGVPLYLSGVMGKMPPVALNLVSALVLVIPVTITLAALESGRRSATFGKRIRLLRVVESASGAPVSFRRALVRNAAKVAIPWAFGHAAVYAIVESSRSGSVPVGVWILTASAYILPLVYLVSLFTGTGRTLYDLLSGTRVIRAETRPLGHSTTQPLGY